MLKLAYRSKRPLILFAEGGGGRPGDVDYMGVAQLDVMTFSLFAGLSGKIPLISIVFGLLFSLGMLLSRVAQMSLLPQKTPQLGWEGLQ